MTDIDIPPTLKGLDESMPYSDQPPMTSRDVLNMRPENPLNGRLMPSQRSGLSKFTSPNSTIDGSNKIQHGTSITYDSRNVIWSALAPVTGSTRWSEALPSGFSGRAVKVGRQSDVYVIDGPAAVVKYNSAGAEQWRCPIPVQDPLHFCRALALDEEENIYVGVSEGGDQTKARIFKLVQGLEAKVHVDNQAEGAWFIEPGGFIEDLAFQDGYLYSAQNFPDRWGSRVVVYTALGTAVPSVAWQHGKDVGGDMAYPINALAVKKNGDYATSHEPFAGRSQGDPRFPFNSPVLEDWTPDLLTNYRDRVWAWLTPNDLDLEEDEEVFIWPDRSGNDRNLYKHVSNLAPRFNRVGIAGRPSIRFAGSEPAVADGQALQSEPNTSTARDFADQQKTLLPSYTGSTDAERAMFALIMVIRPTVDTTIRTLLGQSIASITNAQEFFIAINRDGQNANVPSAGSVCIFDSCVAGTASPPDNRPLDGIISTASLQGAIIAVLHDGGRTTANPKSLNRLNGTGIDRWDSNVRSTLLPTEIGVYSGQPSFQKYQGELGDIFVLRDTTSPLIGDGLISHPYSPDASGSAAGSGAGADAIGTNGDSDLERLEGWAAWKYGMSHILASGHPFSRLKGPPRAAGIATESKKLLLCSENGIVAKWGAGKGNLKWVVTARIAQGSFPAVACSGIGYGLAADEDGNFYATGPTIVAPADATVRDNSVLRKIIDNGDSATISAGTTLDNSPTASSPAGAWNKTSADITGDAPPVTSWTYKYPRLACDKFSNIYVPWHEMNSVAARSVTVWDKTGQYDLAGAYSVTSPGGSDGYAVAIDPNVPEYEEDFAGGSVIATPRAEFFYLGTEAAVGVLPDGIHAVRFSESSPETGSPRTVVHLAIAAGTIKRFTSSTVTAPAGAGTLVAPQLEPTSQFISSAVMNQEAFLIDGSQCRVFNPKDDTVLEWKSRTSGAIPTDAKLLVNWRGCMVLARFGSNPHGWMMSGFADPYDWDTNPPVDVATAAIAGAASQAGEPPDIINTLMTWSDDLMFFGCDHSIFRMSGHPRAGGQFDTVSDQIGASFGPSWCEGPDGELYFFGLPRCGIYKMGLPPVPISDGPIPREMEDIDFGSYFVKLLWNHRDNGFHVFQCPFGAGGVIVQHWFWSWKTRGWWPDKFGQVGSIGVQPTYAWMIDGDEATDRTLLVGCEDGYVRRWDQSARSDDSVLMESRVMLGPFKGRQGQQSRFAGFQIALADDQDGCRYEIAASQTADTPGLPWQQGALSPGENRVNVRAKGNFVWIKLRNAQLNTRWAFERASVRGYPAGRSKERLRG